MTFSNTGGNRPGGNWCGKSAMEHKAVANLKTLGNDRQGYRQWHDKFVNAMAQVNREYRAAMQAIVKAIDREEKLSIGDIDDWEEWLSDNEGVTIDFNGINEDLQYMSGKGEGFRYSPLPPLRTVHTTFTVHGSSNVLRFSVSDS